MILLLLWMELVTAAMLIVALGAVFAARQKRRLAAGGVIALATVPALVMIAAQLLPVIGYRFTRLDAPAAWVGGVGLFLVLLGVIAIDVAALRRNGAGLRKGAFWPVRGLAAAAGLCVALLVMTFWNMTLQAQLEIQALRIRAGTDALQIVPPPVAAGENAAPLYVEGRKAFKGAASPAANDPEYQTIDPASPAATAYLQRQRRALALFREAADRPFCRLDFNYFAGEHEWTTRMESVLHALADIRAAANLLAFSAKAEAARGDMAVALEDLRRIYRTAAHAEESPLLVSGLVGLAIDDLGSETLAELLPRVHDASQLKQLPPLDPAAVRAAFAKTLRGEKLFGTAAFCDAGLGNGTFGTPVLRRAGGALTWFLWFSEDFTLYRQDMDAVEKEFNEPYYQSAAVRARLEREMEPAHRRGLLSAIVMPAFGRMSELVARSEATRECASVAVEVTRHRIAHGTYPTMPTNLQMDLPVDPFDGKPLRYRRNADGSVVIYSVGRNLKDDGGDVKRDGNRTGTDVGLMLPSPAGASTRP